jgi:hypothetical protein
VYRFAQVAPAFGGSTARFYQVAGPIGPLILSTEKRGAAHVSFEAPQHEQFSTHPPGSRSAIEGWKNSSAEMKSIHHLNYPTMSFQT